MGTPPNGTAVGVPGGGLAVWAPPRSTVAFVAVACSILDAVQKARVASCADRLMTCTVPMAGLGADPPGWGAPAGAAVSMDTATTSEMIWDTYHC